MGIPDVLADPERFLDRVIEQGRRAVEEDGAEVIVLSEIASPAFWERAARELPVPLVDPGVACWKWAEMAADLYSRPRPQPLEGVRLRGAAGAMSAALVAEGVALVGEMDSRGLTLRLLGGAGIVLHCERTLGGTPHREIADLDALIARAQARARSRRRSRRPATSRRRGSTRCTATTG